MQRKAYVPGAAVLLAALLAACTGGSGSGGRATDPKAGSTTSAAAPQPGKYRTLADACSAVTHDTLDALLPGLTRMADQEQRDKAYQGDAALTYNNDRRSGCRWKAESTDATDHLFVDFERVVSYDNAVSDDNAAHQVYATKEQAANLPEPSAGSSSSSGSPASPSPGSGSGSGFASPSSSASASATVSAAGASGSPDPSASASGSPSGSPSVTGTPADLQPRTLDDLGDEAFIDDELSTAQQRTVTVVFRTSNVIVTIEYDEQPAAPGTTPSSEDMQDKARKLAGQLAGSLG
ncbi:DUF3558 domain-containing protein [Streptomyces sp. NPDC051104]|uniref:DUF3558 domain-containing protein n=1 Tax=Streptomyces sp. NPDC051104 TaxID=3155044 RepID=UPI00341CE837